MNWVDQNPDEEYTRLFAVQARRLDARSATVSQTNSLKINDLEELPGGRLFLEWTPEVDPQEPRVSYFAAQNSLDELSG